MKLFLQHVARKLILVACLNCIFFLNFFQRCLENIPGEYLLGSNQIENKFASNSIGANQQTINTLFTLHPWNFT